MRVCVIGGGTIGSLVAGHLGARTDVQVLTRRQEHADALNAGGLRVSGKHDHVAPVRAGGATEPANGRALCPRCNLVKGGRPA